MDEIIYCPFRTYQEVRPAVLAGTGDITVTGFMNCMKMKCPAFYIKDEEIPCTGRLRTVEHCKRLE